MRAHDWSISPLGPPEDWAQSLRTTVSLMLNSRYPMFIAWGPELAFLYNDGYQPIFGAKHPHTLGLPFKQVWSEIWADIEPLVDRALAGEATFNENLHLVMARNGFPEDTWYTFSYSPVRDESGGVGGMFCACQETTAQVLLERRLVSEKERQRAMFECAPGFIAILEGPEHVFQFANVAYANLAGRTDFVGRTAREVFGDLEDQGIFELLDQVFRTGRRFIAENIALQLKPPGAEARQQVYLDFVYEPIRDDHGVVTGIFIEGHDVTEAYHAKEASRQHAQHLELLNDELNHRVKNTLAIIQGLAHQTFKGDAATPEARASFEGRLLALASAHNILVRGNWEEAELKDVVADTFRGHTVSGRRWAAEGPPVRLEPKSAVTLAMTLHELATNARKYGSLSGDQGRVGVTWQTTGDGQLRLIWQEHDGPTVAEPRRKGFGSRMIERALGAELQGTANLSFEPTGVVCEIRLPLPTSHSAEIN
ncbi:sensor histidine kinase [Brevundimonas sp. TWP3-1-2b1]